MRVWTLEALPQDYAMVQRNLGATYQIRLEGERQENLYLALAAHHESLRIYTLDAFPIEHRQVQLDCAETQALREDWGATHSAYVAARRAEDLLVALGAGAAGRDAVLKEGRAAAIHDGFALTRLGKIEEAAVAIERGRASGLAQAVQFNMADPERISNPERRIRYRTTHQAFSAAQALLQASHPTEPDENSQRQIMLERTATYREARVADSECIRGGCDCAQRGNVLEFLQAWPGRTLRECAGALHAACLAGAHTGKIDGAAQLVFALPPLAPLIDQPFPALSEENSSLLASTLNHAVLRRELQHCQSVLNRTLLQPLIRWLHEAGVCSLTLVPCGRLAAFPLAGTLLPDGQTLGEILPTSVAPSARALLHDK